MALDDFTQSRRYYHAVVFDGNYSLIPDAFYVKWGIQEDRQMRFESQDCSIKLLRMISSLQYFGGEIDNSQNSNGAPPYYYQIIAIELTDPNVLIMCFPLKKLTINLATSLWREFNVSQRSSFINVELNDLIHLFDDNTDLNHNDSLFNLTGVYVNSAKKGSILNSIKLSGDNPLKSPIYNEFLKRHLSTDYNITKEVVRCHFPIKSSLHIDRHGNYKVYIQEKGKNILSLAIIFKMLFENRLLGKSLINPVLHINEADSDE
jgi:hypothetical protein